MSKNPTKAKRAVAKIASEIVQSPEKKRRSLPAITSPKSLPVNSEDEAETGKKAKANERTMFPRDRIDPIPLVDGQKYLRVISWNVNGLKALVTNNLSVLQNLVNKHQPDILCLQETKIQEQMVDEYRDLLPNYCSYWNCCTVKKGYSGTVRTCHDNNPEAISIFSIFVCNRLSSLIRTQLV
jgi:exodeoxyribonuclease-3